MEYAAPIGSNFDREITRFDADLAVLDVAMDDDVLTLESLVESEMRQKGFDPTNPTEVENYWDVLLQGGPFLEDDFSLLATLQAHLSMQGIALPTVLASEVSA